jgi:hypothetical protein
MNTELNESTRNNADGTQTRIQRHGKKWYAIVVGPVNSDLGERTVLNVVDITPVS